MSKHRRNKKIYTLKATKAEKSGNVSIEQPAFSDAGKSSWWARYHQFVYAALFSLPFLIIYFATTLRSVPTGDSGELITASWILGVAHAPGYPTFTLLSRIAGLLPFGTPAFRLNLLSAFLDALALGVLFWGSFRFFSQQKQISGDSRFKWLIPAAGAAAGVGLLAVSNVFWLYSSVAEVFALNNLLAAITIVLMLEWVGHPENKNLLLLAGLFAGLGMTNQHTFLLLAPGLFTLLIGGLIKWRRKVSAARLSEKKRARDPGWRINDLAQAAGLFAIGLLPYLYLLIASQGNPPLNFGNPSNLSNFLRVILRSDYGTLSFTADVVQGDRLQQLTVMGGYFWHAFTPFGVLFALLGVVWFARRKKLEGAGLGLAFLVTGPVFALVANPSLQVPLAQGVFERFYILPSIFIALFLAAGVFFSIQFVVGSLYRLNFSKFQKPAVITVLVIVIVSVGTLAITRYPSIKISDNKVVENYGYDILEPLAPDSLLITANDDVYSAVVYSQYVLGIRTDVIALHAPLLKGAWYVQEQRQLHPEINIPFDYYDGGVNSSLADLIEANIGERPVYGTGDVKEDVSDRYDVTYWGLSVRYLEKGQGTDPWVLMRPEIDYFAALHYPDITYPAKYWESIIGEHYGKLAFLLAYDRQQPEAQPDAAFVENLYRTAIVNAPDFASSYKDLGLLLWQNGGSADEIISLWEKYLQMAPDDPQNSSIRGIIETLRTP